MFTTNQWLEGSTFAQGFGATTNTPAPVVATVRLLTTPLEADNFNVPNYYATMAIRDPPDLSNYIGSTTTSYAPIILENPRDMTKDFDLFYPESSQEAQNMQKFINATQPITVSTVLYKSGSSSSGSAAALTIAPFVQVDPIVLVYPSEVLFNAEREVPQSFNANAQLKLSPVYKVLKGFEAGNDTNDEAVKEATFNRLAASVQEAPWMNSKQNKLFVVVAMHDLFYALLASVRSAPGGGSTTSPQYIRDLAVELCGKTFYGANYEDANTRELVLVNPDLLKSTLLVVKVKPVDVETSQEEVNKKISSGYCILDSLGSVLHSVQTRKMSQFQAANYVNSMCSQLNRIVDELRRISEASRTKDTDEATPIEFVQPEVSTDNVCSIAPVLSTTTMSEAYY